jgi:N-acetylglucosamine-6-phosphate deacetylase
MVEEWIAKDIDSDRNYAVQVRGEEVVAAPTSLDAAKNLFISQGWVDLQVNGFAGYDINAPDLTVDQVRAVTVRLWQEGVAAWCPAVITAASDQIEHSLRTIDQACRTDPVVEASIAGIHLEGPYLSAVDGARGVHPAAHIHPPDWGEFSRWQAAAGRRIRILTLAPELPGAADFIKTVVQSGVIVALGHTRASSADIRRAVEAGARLSTHLGNGIESVLPRHPNPIWDQLAEDQLSASLIFDGFHLPASVMKVMLRAKGIERCILISDSSTLARLEPGIYDTPVGGKVQLHPNGRLSMYGTGYLAGSASSLKDGLENAVRLAGCTLREAVSMVSTNPANLLGYHPNSKTLFSFDPQINHCEIVGVCIENKLVYRNPHWKPED